MPGWIQPFDTNLEMRDFAQRTIRKEVPSHLLPKICWVGNEGFIQNPCNPVVNDLAELLEKGSGIDKEKSCKCAEKIYKEFSEVFEKWFEDKLLVYIHRDPLKSELEKEFKDNVDHDKLQCVGRMEGKHWDAIVKMLVEYFCNIAINGYQFERFEKAWCEWLEANSPFVWSEERLEERIERLLSANVVLGEDRPSEEDLCKCAATILKDYGKAFYNWMNENFEAGNSVDDLTKFNPPPVTLCNGDKFGEGTSEKISKLLGEKYKGYQEVSYRLRTVVDLLNKLQNIYPGATIHDCDDGGDENPVRLGTTALGNYPLHEPEKIATRAPGTSDARTAPARGTLREEESRKRKNRHTPKRSSRAKQARKRKKPRK
jgi:hypothetical protein